MKLNKNEKLKKLFIALMILTIGCLINLQAQEAITSSGGDASSSGGSISYSIGQVFFATQTGTNGNTVAQGVQQPYEISVTVGIIENVVTLKLWAYPNPVSDYLILEVEDFTNLNYKLYDLQGKIIENKKILDKISFIKVGNLASAIYFLKVTKNNKEVKIFKIIKNKI